MTQEEVKCEFSHTVLHNQRINVSQNKLQDHFNNLKIVSSENVAPKKPDIIQSKPDPKPQVVPPKPKEQSRAIHMEKKPAEEIRKPVFAQPNFAAPEKNQKKEESNQLPRYDPYKNRDREEVPIKKPAQVANRVERKSHENRDEKIRKPRKSVAETERENSRRGSRDEKARPEPVSQYLIRNARDLHGIRKTTSSRR